MVVRIGNLPGVPDPNATDIAFHPLDSEPDLIAERPSVLQSMSSSFFLENEVLFGLHKLNALINEPRADQGQNFIVPVEELIGTGLESRMDFFYGVHSTQQFRYRKAYLQREIEHRNMAGANVGAAILGGIAGGLFSPTNLIGPGMALRRSASALRGAYIGARTNLLGVGIQEAVLQSIQETREPEEFVAGVTAGTFLGGVLGGFAGKISSRSFKQLEGVIASRHDVGSSMVLHDGHQFLQHTPESAAVFEARANQIWQTQGRAISEAEEIEILKEFGIVHESFTDALEGARGTDGTVIMSTAAWDVIERAVTPYRVGMSVEEEALAALSSRNTRRLAAEGGQAIEALIQQEAGNPIAPATGTLSRVHAEVLDALGRGGSDTTEIEDMIRMRQGAFVELSQMPEDTSIQQYARSEYLKRIIRQTTQAIDDSLEQMRGLAEDLPDSRITAQNLRRRASAAVNINLPRRLEAMIRRAETLMGGDRQLLGLLEPVEDGQVINGFTVRFGPTGRARRDGVAFDIDEDLGNLNADDELVAASVNHSTREIRIDRTRLRELFDEQAWTNPRVPGVEPLPANTFITMAEWQRFVIEHETAHTRLPRGPTETLAAYETRINNEALANMRGRTLPQRVSVAAENLLALDARLLDEQEVRMERVRDDLAAREPSLAEQEVALARANEVALARANALVDQMNDAEERGGRSELLELLRAARTPDESITIETRIRERDLRLAGPQIGAVIHGFRISPERGEAALRQLVVDFAEHGGTHVLEDEFGGTHVFRFDSPLDPGARDFVTEVMRQLQLEEDELQAALRVGIRGAFPDSGSQLRPASNVDQGRFIDEMTDDELDALSTEVAADAEFLMEGVRQAEGEPLVVPPRPPQSPEARLFSALAGTDDLAEDIRLMEAEVVRLDQQLDAQGELGLTGDEVDLLSGQINAFESAIEHRRLDLQLQQVRIPDEDIRLAAAEEAASDPEALQRQAQAQADEVAIERIDEEVRRLDSLIDTDLHPDQLDGLNDRLGELHQERERLVQEMEAAPFEPPTRIQRQQADAAIRAEAQEPPRMSPHNLPPDLAARIEENIGALARGGEDEFGATVRVLDQLRRQQDETGVDLSADIQILDARIDVLNAEIDAAPGAARTHPRQQPAAPARDINAALDQSEQLHRELTETYNDFEAEQSLMAGAVRNIEDIDAIASLIRVSDDLSGIDRLQVAQAAAYQRLILGEAAVLEEDIAHRVAALEAIRIEGALEGARARDLRPITDLEGIGADVQRQADRFSIETVEQLVAHLASGQTLRGIGPAKEAAILDAFIQATEMAADQATALRKSIKDLRKKLDRTKPPIFEGGLEESINVLAAPLHTEKAGLALTTPEHTILQRSPIRAHKQILLRLMDTNVLLVENDTGQVINPDNVRTGIAQANSLAVSALKHGPRQQFHNYLNGRGASHADQPGVLATARAKIGNESADVRAARINEGEFYSLVGDAMHDPGSIDAMNPVVQPYIRASVRTMRDMYYLPMLNLWEQNFGATPKVAAMSYLMRLYDMNKILGHEEEFAQAAYADMRGKLREAYRLHPDRFDAPIENLERDMLAQIHRWIEAITSTPASRMPMTWGEHIRSGASPMGRPGRARRAFDFRDVEPDYQTLRPYLNRNIEEVTSVYARTRVPDMMIAAKFGDVKLTEALEGGQAELARLLDEAEQISNPIERRKAMDDLVTGHARDLKHIHALVDQIRGTYQLPLDPHSVPGRVARLGNALKGINHMRIGGGFGLTAVGDVGSSVATNGFVRTITVLTESFRSGVLDGLRHVADRDLDNMIIDLEDVLYSRITAFSDYDPHGPTPSMLEKAIQSGSRLQAQVSLLMPWTNAVKQWGARATIRKLAEQSREFVEGSISVNDLALLRRSSGLSDDELRQIPDLWVEHGVGHDGGPVALGTEFWPDSARGIKSKVARLVIADSDRTAPTPRPGDRPSYFASRIGSLQFQFYGFGFGFTNKLQIPMLQGLSHGDTMFMAQMGVGVSLAMLVYMTKQFASKREIPTDIGNIIQQGVVRADLWGKFQTIDEFSSTFTPFPSVMGLAGPDTFYGYDSTPFIEKAAKLLGGPSVDTLQTAARASMGLADLAFDGRSNTPATVQQVRAIRQIAPYQNLFYMDWLFDKFENGLLSEREFRALGQPITQALRNKI